MRESVLTWPVTPPRAGSIHLREFRDDDLHLALELAGDPYVPLVTSLPARATRSEAAAWVQRQRGRLAEGVGFSFAVADVAGDRALGQIGLWASALREGRATAGYVVSPRARGRGVAASALAAVTSFGWSIPALHRIELHIEPWNEPSIRTAQRAGYRCEGLMRSHQEIGGVRRDMLLFAAVRGDHDAR